MDIMACFRDAWQLLKKYRYLFVIGFLAALNQSDPGIGMAFLSGATWIIVSINKLTNIRGVFAFMEIVLILIFGILGILARIALIRETAFNQESTDGFFKRIKSALSDSTQYLSRIICLHLVLWSPVILLSIAFIVSLVASMNSVVMESSRGNPLTAISVAGAMTSGIAMFILLIPLTLIDTFSFRAIVIKKHSVVSSIKFSLDFITRNAKNLFEFILVLAIISFGISIAVGLLVIPVMIDLAFDSLQTSMESPDFHSTQSEPRPLINFFMRIGSAILFCGLVAFQSISTTIFFRRLDMENQLFQDIELPANQT